MKKTAIIFMILFLSAGMALAGTDVTLQWQANTEPDLAGYRVYRGTQAGGPYTQVGTDIACGPNVEECCTFVDQGLSDGTYFWVATAFDTGGLESEYSNEVTATLDSTAPAPPKEMNVFKKVIAYIKKYYEGYTVSISKTEPSG